MYELLSMNPWQQATFGGRSIINTGAQAGTWCEQMVLPAAVVPRNVFQNIAVKHDTSYTVSGWMSSNAVNTNGSILVFWYNTPNPPAGIAFAPAGYIQGDTIGIITGTTGWTAYSKTITAPATALSAMLYLGGTTTSTSTGTIWFDSFSFANSANLSNNILLDPGFENGLNQSQFEVNEFTLLNSAGNDLIKDSLGFVSGANEPWGDFYAFDNMVADTSAIPFPATVSLPGTPQNLNRTIYNVVKGTGNDALAIQTKIDSAALQPLGSKPVVHIPIGTYNINTTLTIPAGSNMQIVGDGLGTGVTTRLNWSGNEIGPLMHLLGPSRATIKDLLLNVPYASYVGPEALVIEDADQVGGRIYGNQFDAGGPQWTQPCDVGLYLDGIENSDVTMACFYPGYGNNGMVKANGGPVLSAGGNTNGQISLLAGATGDCQNLFNVSNGGRIDAEGMWNEGDWARTSGLLNLSNDTGKVSIACMSWNLLTNAAHPMINTDNFSGTLTLLLNHLNNSPQTYVPLAGNGSGLNVLSAYNDFGQSATIGGTTNSTWQDITSPDANSDFISNVALSGYILDDVVSKVHNVRADSTSILNDLAQLRAVRTEPPTDRAAGVTDVKIFRVAAWGTQGHIAAHFNRASITTGIEQLSSKNATGYIALHPTIVSHNYTVSYTLPKSETTYISVFDVFGKQVSEQKINDTEGSHQLNYLADGLSEGTYFLRFLSG